MSRFIRVPTLIVWLTCLWVALWADLTIGNVLGGLAVAIGVVLVARPTGVTGLERTYFRPFSAGVYAGYFLSQLVKSNLIVAWEIVTPGSKMNRAIIAVDMHTTSPGVLTLVANSVTLTPGTVTVDVYEHRGGDGGDGGEGGEGEEGAVDRRTLFIHVLHFVDVQSVRRDVLRLERLAIKAFGSRDELPLVDAELARLSAGSTGASR